MKTKIISTIAIVTSISTLVLGVLFFQNNNSNKRPNENTKIKALQLENDFYLKVIEAENALAKFQYDEALNIYKNLDIIPSQESFVAQKVTYIQNLASTKNTTNDDEKLLAMQETMLQEFKKKSDSLTKSVNKQRDSLLHVVAELKEKSSLASKTPQNKDNVQVITFKGTRGNQIHYLGEVVNGKANGGGVGIWANGSIYKGEWKNNIRHGEGTYEWADGVKYVGSYVDGKRKGFGKYYWPSGERYEGQWENDRRNGFGKLFDPDGNIRFEGNWIEDKPVK